MIFVMPWPHAGLVPRCHQFPESEHVPITYWNEDPLSQKDNPKYQIVAKCPYDLSILRSNVN